MHRRSRARKLASHPFRMRRRRSLSTGGCARWCSLNPRLPSGHPSGGGGNGTFSSTLQPTAQLICGMHQSRRLVKHIVHKPKPELEQDLFRIQMFGMMAGSQGPEV